MTNKEYLEFTRTTVIYPKDQELVYLALGLVSESGETAGKIKKIIRDRKDISLNTKGEIIAELGDTLYYLTRLADHLGVDLDHLIANNHAKLSSRKERGVIGGAGDNR